ncbi:class I tRNA ligase family protein [Desmospora profundinema]|uniref:Methionyl-tRNA synthetase n=1 Tax=Desmospora profundinema TaxID=1571184 RepID=A0ABU1IRC8_9BACL|nr:class I tRNA ligase family protein [Desmospora profundinema]MDR6227351.1 methionyl-tRNA synthetase [Desmospora profundinema]
MGSTQRYLVTAAPPTPNGDLHIGHLAGPFLGADVFSRFRRLEGHDVLYLSYTDDYQEYVQRTALENGETAQSTADRFTRSMQKTLRLSEMHPDHFFIPRSGETHREVMQSFFQDLYRQGSIKIETVATYYCEHCRFHCYEGLVRGHCHYCGDPSDATYCESCGFPQEPGKLKDAHCTQCGQTLAIRYEKRAFFRLADWKRELESYYSKKRSWRPRLQQLCKQLLNTVEKVPVSRLFPLGIPVPLEEMEEQVLDTWYGGAAGYISATRDWAEAMGKPERWKAFWESEDTKWVGFLGFDCGFSHGLLYPAMLKAQDRYMLPHTMITNEFYRLDNRKISTSRRHAIWGEDIFTKMDPSAVRFYLCLTAPEQEQTNFSTVQFRDLVNKTLVEKWNPWLLSLLRQSAKLGTVDLSLSRNRVIHPHSLRLQEYTLYVIKTVSRYLSEDTFSLREAAREITLYATEAISHYHHICKSYTNRLSDLATNLEAARTLSVIAAPFMPGFSRSLRDALGEEPNTRDFLWRDLFKDRVLLTPQVPRDPFFSKVDEKQLTQLYTKTPGGAKVG